MAGEVHSPVFVGTWSFGKDAARAAHEHWQQNQDLDAACVEGTAVIELESTIPTVGIGGLPNREGVVELDAGFMRGRDLKCGSVAALRVTCPAIKVAHAVAMRTNHVMLAGQGADAFALAEGFQPYLPDEMLTATTRREYETWRSEVEAGKADSEKMVGHDTLGLLGWHAGQSVACVATSGLGFKRPGRVGDSPIVGAGLYADDEAGSVACTGIGEELYRHAVASRVIERMRAGEPAQDATVSVLGDVLRREPSLATRGMSVIAIDRDGQVGSATTQTTNHVFEYYVCTQGEIHQAKATRLPPQA